MDFELIEAEQIPLGRTVASTAGNARCASLGYGGMGGAECRRLAVTVSASGTLVVTLSATRNAPFYISILRPSGEIAAYRASFAPMELTATVGAGLTYQVDVAAISTSVREFQLSTMLR